MEIKVFIYLVLAFSRGFTRFKFGVTYRFMVSFHILILFYFVCFHDIILFFVYIIEPVLNLRSLTQISIRYFRLDFQKKRQIFFIYSTESVWRFLASCLENCENSDTKFDGHFQGAD